MVVILVRHGNAIKVDEETPLTVLGRDQSQRLATRLKQLPVARCVSSSLLRARQTYEIVKPVLPDHEYVENSMFVEVYRVLVGGPVKEGTRPNRAEEDFLRAEKAYKELEDYVRSSELTLVFCHGNIIRLFTMMALGIKSAELWTKLKISETSLTQLSWDSGVVVDYVADISHLDVVSDSTNQRNP